MTEKVMRKIVEINEELCDGCGQCMPNCAEGALLIIDSKAKLISDIYCDGLGACLGNCPKGAITIVEKEADPFNKEAVHLHLKNKQTSEKTSSSADARNSHGSALRNWPVQLRLVSVKAPFFEKADVLVAADCVPFAYPDLHGSLLAGKSVVIGCPKFDDVKDYAEKLGEILRQNEVKSITLVNMEVPCCFGLSWVIDTALKGSGETVPVRRCIVTVKGELKEVKK